MCGNSHTKEVVKYDVSSFTLSNLSGVFKILLYGLTLSTIVFVLKWIHFLFSNDFLLKVMTNIRSLKKSIARQLCQKLIMLTLIIKY